MRTIVPFFCFLAATAACSSSSDADDDASPTSSSSSGSTAPSSSSSGAPGADAGHDAGHQPALPSGTIVSTFGEDGAMAFDFAVGAIIPDGDGFAFSAKRFGLASAAGVVDPVLDGVTSAQGSYVDDIARFADGSFLLSTEDAVQRMRRDGSIDPAFTADPTAIPFELEVVNDEVYLAVVSEDATRFGVQKLDASGHAVAGFSDNYTPDGRSISFGTFSVAPSGASYALSYEQVEDASIPLVSHVTPQGAFDTAFGADGFLTPTALGVSDSISSVQATPDGGVLVLARSAHVKGIALAKILPSGALDASYGDGGLAEIPLDVAGDDASDSFAGNALTLQPDGKAVVCASWKSGKDDIENALVVFRVLPDGHLDESFGKSGKTDRFQLGGAEMITSSVFLHALAVTSQGLILIGGYSPDVSSGRIVALAP